MLLYYHQRLFLEQFFFYIAKMGLFHGTEGVLLLHTAFTHYFMVDIILKVHLDLANLKANGYIEHVKLSFVGLVGQFSSQVT